MITINEEKLEIFSDNFRSAFMFKEINHIHIAQYMREMIKAVVQGEDWNYFSKGAYPVGKQRLLLISIDKQNSMWTHPFFFKDDVDDLYEHERSEGVEPYCWIPMPEELVAEKKDWIVLHSDVVTHVAFRGCLSGGLYWDDSLDQAMKFTEKEAAEIVSEDPKRRIAVHLPNVGVEKYGESVQPESSSCTTCAEGKCGCGS